MTPPPKQEMKCPACGLHVTGLERNCPKCGRKFGTEFRFECPYCGDFILKGSTKCPSCHLSLSDYEKKVEPQVIEKTTEQLLDEIISIESAKVKNEDRRFACPGCSWLLEGTETKCPKCGRIMSRREGYLCPVCGAPVPMGTQECLKCGAQLSKGAPTQIPVPPPPHEVRSKRELELEARLNELLNMSACPNCGVLVKANEVKCPKCGANLVMENLKRDLRELESDEGRTKAVVADTSSAAEAIETLGEIEKQTRLRPRSRKLRSGNVTKIETSVRTTAVGLSNGVGQINGLVNGRGKINGVGRVNGTGFTNGKSLVNGTGVSNGLRMKGRTKETRRGAFLIKWQFLAVLVAIAIIIPALVSLSYFRGGTGFAVDGDFGEWSDTAKFGARTQATSAGIAIAEWSVASDASRLYFYVKAQANMFAAQDAQSFYLLVDSDGSASTGYLVDALGANYMLQVQGWNSTIQSTALFERSGSTDQYDWSTWVQIDSLTATARGVMLEAEAHMPVVIGDAAKYMLMSKDSLGSSAVSHVASPEGGLLIVFQEPAPTVSDDGIVALATSVTMLNLRFTCQGLSGTVNAVIPNVTGAPLSTSIESFSLEVGEDHVVSVGLDTSTVASGQLVTAEIISSGITSTFATIEVLGDGASAYAGTPPSSIVIDGAFADWTGMTVKDQDAVPVANPNADIDELGNVNTSGSSYFYVSVVGGMCRGTYIPAVVAKPSGGGGGGGGIVEPTRISAEDALRIYIDSDKSTSTGFLYSIGAETIGADQMILVRGVYGRIVSASEYSFSSNAWVITGATVNAKNDLQRIEIGVSSSSLGGSSNISYMIETTSWSGDGDTAMPDETYLRSLASAFSGGIGFEDWPVDANTASRYATAMSYQRKTFYDGTNYWSFYFDGTNTVHKYSIDDGVTWTARGSVFKTTGVNETSIWYDSTSNVVYAVGDTSTASRTIAIQRGNITPATHSITWATSDASLNVSTNDLAGKNTFICRDANGYLWILSSNRSLSAKYDLTAFKSTAANSIYSWAYSGQMLGASANSDTVKGSIVPAGSGSDVWGVYIYAGTVAARKYTGTWLNPQSSIYSGGGSSANTENSPPSVVVDSKGVVHVVYGTGRKSGQNSIPSIEYSRNDSGATSFPLTGVDLDQYIPADVGDYYPTISLDSSTDNLYVFWLRSDTSLVAKTIMGRKCVSSTWSNLTFGSQTTYAKQYMNSIYSVSGESKICWQWTQNTTSPDPIQVMFDTKIPEFSEVALPVMLTAAVFVVYVRRTRKKNDETF